MSCIYCHCSWYQDINNGNTTHWHDCNEDKGKLNKLQLELIIGTSVKKLWLPKYQNYLANHVDVINLFKWLKFCVQQNREKILLVYWPDHNN